jgi:predicted  nucleic acid-binding Zn-ribbon protein
MSTEQPDEPTCGEISCDECNERYAKARAEIESLRKRVAELQEKRVALAAQVKDLKAREDRQTGSWNTLANCADTLRSRDFGTEYGAIDERVIAMAKALDASRLRAERLQAALEQARRPLEFTQKQLENQRRIFGEDYFDDDLHGEITDALATITAALAGDTAKPNEGQT